MKLFTIIITLTCSLIISCNTDQKELAATINGKTIPMSELDNAIKSQLYMRLFDIYYNRSIALDNILNEKLITLEAVNRGISVDSLRELEIYSKLSEPLLNDFAIENELTQGIPDQLQPGRLVDPNSEKGKMYLKELFFKASEKKYIETLKSKYNVKTFLSPPLTPRIQTENIITRPLNKTDNKISVVIASDFDCPSCRSNFSIVKQLIEKNQDRISFYYAHLSGEVTEPMLFSECASENSGFYDVYTAMFENIKGDTIDYNAVASQLSVDLTEIRECMQQKSPSLNESLQSSIQALRKEGVTFTPALIIDGRIYYGEFTQDAILKYISEISENQ